MATCATSPAARPHPEALFLEALADAIHHIPEWLREMYGPPRYCKVFVCDAPACVNVSGL